MLDLPTVLPNALAASVVALLAAELAVPESEIAPEQRLVEDLGLDSVDAVRILAAIEGRFDIELVSTDYVEVVSVADLIRFVGRVVGEGSSA